MKKIQQLYNIKTQILAAKDYDVREILDIINKMIAENK